MTEIAKKTGTFSSYDGTTIYYEVRGEGKPIVFCYGLACLMNHWTHQLKYFSNHYQTIILDYRAHHSSSAPADKKELSIDAICKDIEGLCNHLGIEKASFWGHSLGVQLLLRYYDLHPERVENMVFINGFTKNPLKGPANIDVIGSALRIFKDVYQAFPGQLSSLWKFAVTNPLMIPLSSLVGGFNLRLTNLRDIEVYARGMASMDLEVFITLFEQMMDYDATPVLEKINVPVLIVSGTKDGVTKPELQERMHEQIRGSELLRVPYGSHCTQLDLPDFVNLRAEKFLNEIGYV